MSDGSVADRVNQKITADVSRDSVAAVSDSILAALVPALVEALQHMRVCADCAEGSWEDCEGGRAALVAMEMAKAGEPNP